MIAERNDSNSAFVFAILAVAFMACAWLAASPLDNIAPAHLSAHAIERHGADARRVYEDWCNGFSISWTKPSRETDFKATMHLPE